MRTLFTDDPPAKNFLPWTHVPNRIPLDMGVKQTPTQPIPAASPAIQSPELGIMPSKESRAVRALRVGWMKKKTQIFAGKQHTPDAEDPNAVNHLDWYEATGFTRPYPGEKKVLPASAFKKTASTKIDTDD
jgi:hypothetical protein